MKLAPPPWPTSISGRAKNAVSAAKIMSQQAASTQPAPSAAPCTAAMTGLELSRMQKKPSRVSRFAPGIASRRAGKRGLFLDVRSGAEHACRSP